MPSTTFRRAVAATAMAAALALLTPTIAFADHGGDANSGTPDNKSHGIDRNSVTALGDTATKHGIAQLNRTKMDASLSTSGDVEVYDAGYGNSGEWKNVAGKTDCTDSDWFNVCGVYRVRFNQSNMSSSSVDWKVLGCHELGHTAGLGHRTSTTDTDDNSCMRSGLYTSRNANFDAHDINAVNSTDM